MSAHPFDASYAPDYAPHARAAQAEQQAAIDAMRAKMAGVNTPMLHFPFGKQQPLSKYVGVRVLPFVRNPFVSDPSVLLKEPDPTAHYGFAKRTDPSVRGKLRSRRYEEVFIDELRDDNDAAIEASVETFTPWTPPGTKADEIEKILTERGPCRLVLWHELMLVKIPYKTWLTEYEEPALMSVARLTQHQQAFQDFSARSVTTTTTDEGAQVHEVGGDYREMRGHVQTSMTVEG